MDFEFSNHALARMESRSISKETALDVINNPDSVYNQDEVTSVYSKVVQENSKLYLYRVFVNSKKNPMLVITAYKTSKTDKYDNQIQ